jgi:phenylalanyl-tRNA synthetase alpha chain
MLDRKKLINQISTERDQAIIDIDDCKDLEVLKKIHSKYFGKDSYLSKTISQIKNYDKKDKIEIGQFSNKVKGEIQNKIKEKELILKNRVFLHEIERDIDVTLSTNNINIGSIHPISQMMDNITDNFKSFGFSIASGPEIETDWFCFQALNMDIHHPARDMQDTFYIEENHILPRTHTSSMQIRTMLKQKPPIRILAPGKVYRNENADSRHSFMFYQYEGLVIDKSTNVSDLKSFLTIALRNIFENDKIEIRFRHSYFPYTEPSFEVDATCILCQGKGCNVCSNKGWIELLGGGMVHPQVLRNVNIDPEIYQGFAFGGGPERLLIVKNMIQDTRYFFENDLRFLNQFKQI